MPAEEVREAEREVEQPWRRTSSNIPADSKADILEGYSWLVTLLDPGDRVQEEKNGLENRRADARNFGV